VLFPPKARTGLIGPWAAVSGLAVAGGSVVGQVHVAAASEGQHALDLAVASFLRVSSSPG
jgi:hypothetical protein